MTTHNDLVLSMNLLTLLRVHTTCFNSPLIFEINPCSEVCRLELGGILHISFWAFKNDMMGGQLMVVSQNRIYYILDARSYVSLKVIFLFLISNTLVGFS